MKTKMTSKKGRQWLSLIATVFISQLLLQWFQNELNISLVFNFVFRWHTIKFLISWLVLLVPAIWIWAVVGKVRLANLTFFSLSAIIGFISFEKMRQRSEPLYPSDFSMVSSVGSLVEMLTPTVLFAIVILVLMIGVLLFFVIRQERKQTNLKLSKRSRMVMLLVSSLGLAYLSTFSKEGNLVKKAYDYSAYWIPYSQQMNYYNNGFVAGFLYNLPADPMDKPAGDEGDVLQTIEKTYSEKAAAINSQRSATVEQPNIIFIMNESFADPFDLKETSQVWDPIPFTRTLSQESWSGRMLSQGYGGGTANIEFEALTALSMEPFAAHVSTPFTQFLPKETTFPSIVSKLKGRGYYATAIHPYNTSMYKRRQNYDNLAFDAFYYDETMTNRLKIDNNPYISDQSAYDEVIQVMADSVETDFVHLVTMQNHMPYAAKYDDYPLFQETGYRNEKINQYLQDLNYSDQALEQFYEDLQVLDEPTAVVFWGDHWPSVFGEKILENNGQTTLHQTPAIIFTNYLSDSQPLGLLSPIYFYSELARLTDQPVSGFDAFLMDLRQEVPAFEKGMYYSKEKEDFVKSRDDLSEQAQHLLEIYDWIMYDMTTGKKTLINSGFFDDFN